MDHRRERSQPRILAAIAGLSLLLLLPTSVVAHAELDRARPEDGATVEGTPDEVVGRFTQDIDPDGSSMLLRDPAGTTIAEGALDPDNDRRRVIGDLPDLAPGEYTVRWTTNSAEDGEIARGTWSFTVVAAPTVSPTATPTPSATATAVASATPAVTEAPTPTPESSPTPGPTAPPSGASGGGDVVLPIIAGLAIVAVAGGYLLTRRGRGSGPA
jgi:methionine-rich copper-binding protein CopC